MLYTTLKVQDEEYKLRLTTKTSVQLEKSLGYNPISMLMQIDNGVMPKMGDILIMLQAMLSTYQHGYNMDKTYELFDLIPVFVEVFQNSGYISAVDEEEETKN